MFVKMCGTTSVEDARMALDAGADALGFVFAPSKRQVDAAQVAAILGQLQACEAVGVFTDANAAMIAEAVRVAGLTAVQLHAGYDAERIRELRQVVGPEVRILQAVKYAVDAEDRKATDWAFREEVRQVLNGPAVWAVLLDAAKSGSSGGLGVSFDWRHVRGLLDEVWPKETQVRLLLAGGLTPENVRDAIGLVQPDGVDVVSGIEERPGRKSAQRVQAFLASARTTQREAQPES